MSILFFNRVAQNVPHFLFHAAPVLRSTAFQARFHIVFQIAAGAAAARVLILRRKPNPNPTTCSLGALFFVSFRKSNAHACGVPANSCFRELRLQI